MDYKKFILAGIVGGIVYLVLSQALQYLIAMVLPYDVLALAGMREVTDPIMMLFFASPWVYSFTMSFVYPYFSKGIPGKGFLEKGKKFGFLMWIAVAIPSVFVVWSSMNYPIGFTINQAIGGLITLLATGITIAKFME